MPRLGPSQPSGLAGKNASDTNARRVELSCSGRKPVVVVVGAPDCSIEASARMDPQSRCGYSLHRGLECNQWGPVKTSDRVTTKARTDVRVLRLYLPMKTLIDWSWHGQKQLEKVPVWGRRRLLVACK